MQALSGELFQAPVYPDWGKVGKEHETFRRKMSHVETEQTRVAVGYNFCWASWLTTTVHPHGSDEEM
jgi:hypothetical protein